MRRALAWLVVAWIFLAPLVLILDPGGVAGRPLVRAALLLSVGAGFALAWWAWRARA